jgi:hypothetical protein
MLDVRSTREVDCDTNHFLMVAEVKGRLSISKQATRMQTYYWRDIVLKIILGWKVKNSISLKSQTVS